ncbi:MAG TPA: lmo0937 family membrane protein [Candidatus Colwellbacteria bacterium]|nr:lmo0937 family membrane protein [Candidatus Colwellbacteria bacterium]
MWSIIGIVLLVAWVAGFFVFKIAGVFIHLLLIMAVISFLVRIIRGK